MIIINLIIGNFFYSNLIEKDTNTDASKKSKTKERNTHELTDDLTITSNYDNTKYKELKKSEIFITMNMKRVYENNDRKHMTVIKAIKLILVAPIEVIGGDINTIK
ncbi:hypothetical protein [Cellulophaga baltica]|uniref:hypothetical protein n=1 Tax=Cellulophaga baltica TaxID=76594 RepID=UPI0015F77A96|nr:hypothetical protein [Cellulophaga baltica]MBA6316547.1 hypothetical protein [Cellulophaga baltica]